MSIPSASAHHAMHKAQPYGHQYAAGIGLGLVLLFSFVIMGRGLDEWREKILFPAIPENASAEQQAQFAKIKEVSRFFGGTPQTGTVSEQTTMKKEMPKLPTSTGGSLIAPTGGKKKKEGC